MERRSTYQRIVAFATLVLVLALSGRAAAQYGGGSGTPDDPYLICTPEQMNAIGAHPDDRERHFKVMADIDLSQYTGMGFNRIGAGGGFQGVFDGNHHAISGFTWSSDEMNYIGLFSSVNDPNAEIKNLELVAPNIDAGAGRFVGALLGSLARGTIRNCHVRGGSVSGGEAVGGLLGYTSGRWPYSATIQDCSSTCAVSGQTQVGGLVGAPWTAIVEGCYAGGSVTGGEQVGGLVGQNHSLIADCYARSDALGNDRVGGLVGENMETIRNCYATGMVVGDNAAGGLVGESGYGSIVGCYWNTETSGQTLSAGGVGQTTAPMHVAATFLGWGTCGSEGTWTIDEGHDYPRLAWENQPGQTIPTILLSDVLAGSGTADDPFLIGTGAELNAIGLFPCEWDKHFALITDIDLATLDDTQFNIIGSDRDMSFTGVFDGNGHTISNFHHRSTNRDCVGLFGYVRDSNAVIKNLGLECPRVDAGTGHSVGALVGEFYGGVITDCYVEAGIVRGAGVVGGLAGFHSVATLANCYVTGSVSGTQMVGGLIGNSGNDIISHCYSTALITGDENTGGLIGTSHYDAIIACFWDVEASGNNRQWRRCRQDDRSDADGGNVPGLEFIWRRGHVGPR